MNDGSGIGKLKMLRDEEPARLIRRIRLVWPEIRAALGRGHTLKRIHLVLQESGIAIHYQVLSRYVCRLRREDAGRAGESAPDTGKYLPSPSVVAQPGETPEPDSGSEPFANIRDRLIRHRPGFNSEGGNFDLKKLI